jgi:hypothetical protein
MDDLDIIPDLDPAGRTYRRFIGWGGAVIFSLLVWAAVFRLIGDGLERQSACRSDSAATLSPSVQCP